MSNTFEVNYYHIVLFCISDIYCMSVHPWKKDPSSMVLPEVSYFPCLGFLEYFLTWSEGLRAEDVTTVQSLKAQ